MAGHLTYKMMSSTTDTHSGLLIVLCGPSGVGKSTISRRLSEKMNVWYTVSATTRPQAPGDENGKTYEHISKPEFFRRLDSGSVSGICPGVRGLLRNAAASGAGSSGQGAATCCWRSTFRGQCRCGIIIREALLIFILPPDEPTLLQRLTDRARDESEEINKRFRAAKREIHMAKGSAAFDYMVVNDRLTERLRRSPRLSSTNLGIRQDIDRIMIEALKSDEIVNKVGGRFKLTALIQKRHARVDGRARPLIERRIT